MKFLIPIAMVVTLSACEITNTFLLGQDKNDTQSTSTDLNSIDASKLQCALDTNVDVTGSVDCETSQDGVFSVLHPHDGVDVPLIHSQSINPDSFVNIWDKIQSDLAMPIPQDNARLDAQRTWYLRHPAYMQRVAKRASPFLYYITQQLEQENMPMELALLPIVESGFDAFGYSHGRASGMWQFIPATGVRFGMKQTWWYDGRRDVIASTQGAIQYLRYLHDMFDGDWLHALAAYNSGEGRVLRSIQKNRRAGKPTDFWSLDLPRETRAYVPKLLALADILKNQREYKFGWPTIINEPVIQVVDVGSQIDLAVAADMANLTITELQALNPGYNRWATDPDGPHRLVIPISKLESFSTALAKTKKEDRVNWVRHKVKSGETLGLLASKYNTNVAIIKQVNNLQGNTIFVNDNILIPMSLKKLTEYSLSVDQRLAKTQSIKRADHKAQHTIVSGDTLSQIASANNVTIKQLAQWNGMAPNDPLQIGVKLVIWTNNAVLPSASSAVMRNLVYTVKSGDSLALIASRFNVKVRDITQWNNLHEQKYLQPGQKLTIKVDVKKT